MCAPWLILVILAIVGRAYRYVRLGGAADALDLPDAAAQDARKLTVARSIDAAQGFHPENFENQKRIWLAEEKQKQEEAARREVRSTAWRQALLR
jgi:hypothetical protein